MAMKSPKPATSKRPLRWDHSRILRAVHDDIERQAAQSIAARQHWQPSDYPALWALVQAATKEAQNRHRLKGRIVFRHHGRKYAARFTNLDRIIVEDRKTGRFLASSGFFAL
jgi:hypothetical protein